jgi:glycosyltransferase involved in cell wall biosynthesis
VKGSTTASALAAAEAALAHRRGTYHKVQRFIAPSRYAAGVARLAGLDGDRVEVIPNFLTDSDLETEVDTTDHGPVFVYAGRLEATKGIRELLRAFRRVSQEASLRIAGDGDLADEVRRAAAEDSRITFLGRLPRAMVLEEFGRARAVLLPSVWEENGPFVILEAQARARAMIVTDRGGPPEFVTNGTSGLTVDPEDVDGLAAAISRLAGDAALAQEWGRNARERVKRIHCGQRYYEALLATYQQAMADL